MREKNTFGDWFRFGAVGQYFLRLFGRRDKNVPINLRLMHGINRITVVIFVLAILFFISKKLFF